MAVFPVLCARKIVLREPWFISRKRNHDMNGYTGKILIIDLSIGHAEEHVYEITDCLDFIGGFGMNTKILMDEMDPSVDALSKENVLTFGVGPLVGTFAPTANRTDISSKSPLTNLIGTSNSGYSWGPDLKFAGYDHVVFKGKSEKPVYVFVHDGKAEILDAGDMWGKDAWDTIRMIKSQQMDEEVSVACIGAGGERLVRFASVENGFYGGWGRSGMGAVMGSKNLKAVAVRGAGEITVSDYDGFRDAVREMRSKISNHPAFKPWRRFGSMLAVDIYYGLGAVTGYDQSELVGEDFIENLGSKNLLKYKKRSIACTACPIACAPWVEIDEGPYKGLKIKGIEITSTMDFGARLGIRNLAAVAKATEYFQRYGIDCSTSAASIAFAIKLFQEGIIDTSDTDGLELQWGDEALIFELMRKMTYREGFGDLLAEGPVRMAKKIGKGSEIHLTQTRGLETNARDPRGRWDVWSFGYLINPRGGDHLRVQGPVENLKESAPEGQYLHEIGLPPKVVDKADIFDDWKKEIFDFQNNTISIPHMAAWALDHMNVVNSLGTCIRPPVLWSLGPTMYAKLLTTLTGISFSPEGIMKAGERITNMCRLFNSKAGERREDIKFGPKFYHVPIKGRMLDKDKIDKVVDTYCEVRNWYPETAVPTGEKVRELGLEKYA
jgi:aldehyde:ferredoxin oxidoreductase